MCVNLENTNIYEQLVQVTHWLLNFDVINLR